MTEHRDMRLHIDDHFAGRIGRKQERTMREHLPGCANCRDYYNRHLLLSRVDAGGIDSQTRLARGLGLQSRWSFQLTSLPVFVTASLSAAICVVALWPSEPIDSSEFRARGGVLQQSSDVIRVFRISGGQDASPVVDRLHAADELAFAYVNTEAKQYLLVFAVDDSGEVYWFFPAWTDERQNPGSTRVEPTSEFLELPSAVSHDYRGSKLWIHALLTDTTLTVKEVEALLAGGHVPGSELPVPHSIQQAISLRIER